MAIDHSIPLQTQSFDMLGMLGRGSELAQFYTKQKTDSEMTRIYNESQGDLDKMLSIAPQSKYARWVMPQLQSQKAAQAKAALDTQKTQANIFATQGKGTKDFADAGSTTQKTGDTRYNLGLNVWRAALQNPKYGMAMLNNQLNSGAIDQATFDGMSNQLLALEGQKPEEVKAFISNQVVSMLDPKYEYPDMNTVLNNEQSDRNSKRTYGAAINGQQLTYELGKDKLTQEGDQFQQKMLFDQQKQYFEQNKPVGFFVDIDGYRRAEFADGQSVKVVGEDGQPIKMQSATQSPQIKESQRIDKVRVLLDEIGGEKDEKGVRSGGVLKQATNSYAGRVLDYVARGLGWATEGDIATGQLGTLGGQLVALMPRMEGPQSNLDVEMYKQMAGKLDDPTLPYAVRKAALDTIESLNERYAKLNGASQGQGIPYANTGQQVQTSQINPKIMMQMP